MSVKARGSNRGSNRSAKDKNRVVQQSTAMKCADNDTGGCLTTDAYHIECEVGNLVTRQTTARRHIYRYRKRIISLLTVAFLTIGGNNVFAADEQPNDNEKFTRSIYAGAGLGVSRLEPDTDELDGRDVDDRTSTSGQINVGVDLYKQLSLELHSANLGTADLSPSGGINYRVNGISALFYAGGNRDRYKRQGLTAYGRGGFGVLSNSPTGNVPLREVDENHWLLGAGVEYTHRSGLGARAEVISVSNDARYGQLGLIYRFGKDRKDNFPEKTQVCLLYTSPSPRDQRGSRMPSSA